MKVQAKRATPMPKTVNRPVEAKDAAASVAAATKKKKMATSSDDASNAMLVSDLEAAEEKAAGRGTHRHSERTSTSTRASSYSTNTFEPLRRNALRRECIARILTHRCVFDCINFETFAAPRGGPGCTECDSDTLAYHVLPGVRIFAT